MSRHEWQRVIAAGLCLVLGALLGWAVAGVFAVGLVLALSAPRGSWLPSTGMRRSVLEIAIPAVAAWFALGGPLAPTVVLSVNAPPVRVMWEWILANWGFFAVVAAFVAVHHGASAVRRPADLPSRHREIVLAYGALVLVLALLEQTIAAGVVAALFIGQWPFQAEFRAGRVRAHLLATQPVAMLAMLVAALGSSG
jgi:hypothetical protein